MTAAVAALQMPLDSVPGHGECRKAPGAYAATSTAAHPTGTWDVAQSTGNACDRRAPVEQAQNRTVHDSLLQEQRRQLDQFLAGVERRALRMAEFSVRNRDDAMEIVQDAMLKLAQSYGHLAPTDWPPLFQRILQSRITDHFRRQKVRNRLFVWFHRNNDDDDYDPIAEAPDETLNNPLDRLSLEQGNTALVEAVESLPERQRQAFLLRHWEGLSEKETAYAMQCSEGSVKTHLSRAMHTLRARLAEHA